MLENEGNVNAPGLKVTGSATSTPPEPPNVGPAYAPPHPLKHVPVISWVRAGGWETVSDPFQPGSADEWIDTTATDSQYAFALRVVGDSMEPEFKEGEIIVVDPELQPESGDFVVAKNGDDATFKQLVRDGRQVFLKPLNSRYPIKDMTDIDFRIVGVVREKRNRYR